MTTRPPTPQLDHELVARVVDGDQRAFEDLYDRYADVVFGVAIRMLGDRQAAEEVVQETYLVLWNRAERYDPTIGPLIGWLVTVARNRATDRLRAAGRRPVLAWFGNRPDDDTPDETLDRAMSRGALVAAAPRQQDPEEAAARSWVSGVVRSALSAIPPEERLALELAYYGDLSQVEIAERLGWPLGTVKTRTRRALGRLRTALDGLLDAEPRQDQVAPREVAAEPEWTGAEFRAEGTRSSQRADWNRSRQLGVSMPLRGIDAVRRTAGGTDGPR